MGLSRPHPHVSEPVQRNLELKNLLKHCQVRLWLAVVQDFSQELSGSCPVRWHRKPCALRHLPGLSRPLNLRPPGEGLKSSSNNHKSNLTYGRKTLLKSERIKTFIGHKYITYTLQIQLGITYSIVFAKSIH